MHIRLQKLKLSDLAFAAVCLFLIAYIASARTNTGFKFFIVRSGSMKPVVNTGDVAIIRLTNNSSKIKEGDIIAFQSSEFNDIVIHRIAGIDPKGYITKGDANEDRDLFPVSSDKVLGVYRFRIPFLGFFFEGIKRVVQLTFVETRLGWLLITGIPVLFIIITVKKKNAASISKSKDENIS